MKNKKKLIVWITIFVLILLLILGLTYAYYRTRIIGNESLNSVSVVSKNLEIKYSDGISEFNMQGSIEPGFIWKKQFSVQNTGSENVVFGIRLENVINTFSRTEDLTYKLVGEGISGEITSVLPISDKYILNSITIPKNKEYQYTLYVYYTNLEDVNQSIDMGKKLSFKVNIAEENKLVNLFKDYNIIRRGNFDTYDGTSDFYDQPFATFGSPTITNSVYNTYNQSAKIFATSSTVFRENSFVFSGQYYVAAKIRVDRYVSGSAGVALFEKAVNSQQISALSVQEVTNNEFKTFSSIVNIPKTDSLITYIGAYNSPNLDAYIDDVVMVPMEVFGNMTIEEINNLYEEYISTSFDYSLSLEKEHVNKFVEKMNEKAKSLKMNNSIFKEPSGVGGESVNQVTARDVMQLIVEGTKNKILNQIWNNSESVIKIKSFDNREKHKMVESTVFNDTINEIYPLKGGKTGTWAKDNYTVNNIAYVTEINGETVVGVVLGSSTSDKRFSALKNLLDVSSNVLLNKNFDTSNIEIADAPSLISCVIRGNNVEILYEKNADDIHSPASITKVLTLLTALDYIEDVNQYISIVPSDLIHGSGKYINSSDLITYENIFYLMMLPSSNESAQTLARNIGRVIK